LAYIASAKATKTTISKTTIIATTLILIATWVTTLGKLAWVA